jgi:hypothetical protein
MSLVPQLAAFTATLAALLVVSRWIGRQVQVVVLHLTGDEGTAQMAYYLLLLPGILLHELSHAVMARLVGLKVGKLSLGPRRRTATTIELGSVTVGRGDAIRESLVGLAPFLAGTVALLLIGYQVFDVGALGRAWAAAGPSGLLKPIGGVSQVPDFWLWAYLVFAISNAMTPSPSDRQPWLLAGLYVAAMLSLLYLLVGLPVLPEALSVQAAGALHTLTLAFLFTLVLDLLAAGALFAAELLIVGLTRRGPAGH